MSVEKSNRNDERKKDVLFVILLLTILVLAGVYFSMPERSEFLQFQFKWWEEMWEVIRGG